MNKLSVIVPVYNVEAYLEECVKSLVEQTYENIEIILVDDGAKDGSGMLCDKLQEKYSSIIVIHQENQGLPFARNAGIQVASGEYIAFVDSDDYVDRNMFKKLIEALENNNCDIAICNSTIFNKKERTKNNRYSDQVIEYSNENCMVFYKNSMDAVWNRIFRRNIIDINHIKFESKSIVSQEDYYFQMKYFTYVKRLVTLSESLYNYRERKSSISRSGQDKDFPQRCFNFIFLTKKYIAEHSNRNVDNFFNYQYANLLMASLNNVENNTTSEILKVINLFVEGKNNIIIGKVQHTLFPGHSPQMIYHRLILKLLNGRMYKLVAILEHFRMIRFRSSVVRDKYYE